MVQHCYCVVRLTDIKYLKKDFISYFNNSAILLPCCTCCRHVKPASGTHKLLFNKVAQDFFLDNLDIGCTWKFCAFYFHTDAFEHIKSNHPLLCVEHFYSCFDFMFFGSERTPSQPIHRQGVNLEKSTRVEQACVNLLWLFYIGQTVPKRIRQSAFLRTLSSLKYRTPKPHLRGPPRVLHITRKICSFSQPCFSVMFHCIRFLIAWLHFLSIYLHLEKVNLKIRIKIISMRLRKRLK